MLIVSVNYANIGSDYGLSPSWCQAIIWTNTVILLIGPWVRNFSEILIQICTFSFRKMHVKMLSGKWWLFWLGLNVLTKKWDMMIMFESVHDYIIKCKYLPSYWPFVRGIHQSLVNSLQKSQWRGALLFSFICTWIYSWVNNRVAGHLRCHWAHYYITVWSSFMVWYCND